MAWSEITNAMTVDVEDYFHVSALSAAVSRTSWTSRESRVCRNTIRILEIFDKANIKATFFVLGWVAERFPDLVRQIGQAGHEIGCHGYSHQLIYTQNRAEFADETRRALDCIQQASGAKVRGYRAASYSITTSSSWALEVLSDLGFEYDSSIVPVRHDLYGIVGSPSSPYEIQLCNGKRLFEFPPATVSLLGLRVPVGGGGYFRIFPYWLSSWGMRRVNNSSGCPFSFYLHPWEIDPEQPRVEVSFKSRFRHYHNLDKFEKRLIKLLHEFRFGTMEEAIATLRGGEIPLLQFAKFVTS